MDWNGWISFRWPLHLLLWSRIQEKNWSSPHGQWKSPKCSTWLQSQNDRVISVHFQGKPFNSTIIQVYSLTSNAEEAEVEWMVLWRPTRPSRTNTHKRCHFFIILLECKSRKSRDTWSNRQILTWSTNEAEQRLTVLPREHTGHSKHPLPTTQEKTLHMDITRWTTPKSDWLYSLQPKMEKLYTVSKNKTRGWLWLRIPYCQIQTQIEESRENH